MYIFFDFPFHCNARPTNHKTHVVLYFTLRSRSENVFSKKKNSGEAARAPETILPAQPPLPMKNGLTSKQVRLFFPQIDRGRFSRYFLETATEIFRIGVPDFISDLRHRKFSCLHQLYGTLDTYHL